MIIQKLHNIVMVLTMLGRCSVVLVTHVTQTTFIPYKNLMACMFVLDQYNKYMSYHQILPLVEKGTETLN